MECGSKLQSKTIDIPYTVFPQAKDGYRFETSAEWCKAEKYNSDSDNSDVLRVTTEINDERLAMISKGRSISCSISAFVGKDIIAKGSVDINVSRKNDFVLTTEIFGTHSQTEITLSRNHGTGWELRRIVPQSADVTWSKLDEGSWEVMSQNTTANMLWLGFENSNHPSIEIPLMIQQ